MARLLILLCIYTVQVHIHSGGTIQELIEQYDIVYLFLKLKSRYTIEMIKYFSLKAVLHISILNVDRFYSISYWETTKDTFIYISVALRRKYLKQKIVNLFLDRGQRFLKYSSIYHRCIPLLGMTQQIKPILPNTLKKNNIMQRAQIYTYQVLIIETITHTFHSIEKYVILIIAFRSVWFISILQN